MPLSRILTILPWISLPISNSLIKEISNVLEKYQIKIERVFSKKYIKNFIEDKSLELSLIAFKIQNGQNQNHIWN